MLVITGVGVGTRVGAPYQVEVSRPLGFFLSALPLRNFDLRTLALSAALRRAVLLRWLRVFMVFSFGSSSSSSAAL